MELEKEIKTARFNNQVHKAAVNILFTSHWLKTKFSLGLKQFGLTSEQYNILRILKGKHPEPMRVKDIGSRMIERNSNVPRILDRLERKGLIVRKQSEQDRRETETGLTEKGMDLVVKAIDYTNANELNMMNLDEETAGKLNAILDKLRD